MLEIKHTICPSCSVGCGISVVIKDEKVVGTYPYRRDPINKGKNCLNSKNAINSENKLSEAKIDKKNCRSK